VKGLLKIGLLSMVAVSAAALAQQATAPPIQSDSAYLAMKKMQGGVWHTKVNGTEVESRWTYGPDGTAMLGDTILDPHGKQPMHLMSRFGWDDAAKQVYYLDAHGLDTIYFGHVTTEGNDLVMKFKGIVGDPGEYLFRITFANDNAYHATLYMGEGGKQGKVVENFDWSRTKE
jgi:hypothetical protein